MTKNLYYTYVVRRRNVIKEALLNFFLGLSSYPRLLLEVFLRPNMGERYFSMATSITMTIILVYYPIVKYQVDKALAFTTFSYSQNAKMSFWGQYLTWYLFLALFVFYTFKRFMEVRRNPSVFDFGRFSLCRGDIHPAFFKITLFGWKANRRSIAIFYEPALFLIAGILLSLLSQKLGTLLIMSSIIYSFSYMAAYKRGDDFIMDIIDNKIMNEDMGESFVENPDGISARGTEYFGKKPKAKSSRQNLADEMVDDSETTFAL